MTLPANVRINTTAPFPSRVSGQPPMSIARNNGVWTIGFSMAALQTLVPPVADYPTDYIMVWNSLTGIFFRVPLNGFPLGGRQQRSVTVAGDLPATDIDMILNINSAVDLTPPAPVASTRNGTPITFKNLAGSATQTITAIAPDTFDGLATYPLISGASVTFVPYTDGTNDAIGYAIES